MLHKPTSTVYPTSDVAVHQALQYKYQWYYDKWSYLNKTQVLWFTDLWGAAYWNRHKNGSVNKKKKKKWKTYCSLRFLRKSWGSSWGSRNSISWRESRGKRTVYLIVLLFVQIIVFQVMFQCVYNAKFFNCFELIISKSETNFSQDFPSRVILTKSMFKYCKIIFKSSINCEANLKILFRQ